MTLKELKEHIMFQTNNDADDLGDYLPHIVDYINEGYDKVVTDWCGEHVSVDSDNYTPLSHDKSQPDTPDWTHRAIADWATWLIYRNGSSVKQNRGMQYRYAAETLLATIRGMTDGEKGITRSDTAKAKRYIINIPR